MTPVLRVTYPVVRPLITHTCRALSIKTAENRPRPAIFPGDIYSKIFSEFQNLVLVPQHDGKRKNIVFKSDEKQTTFLPLSYPGDAPSLLSKIVIPVSTETGLETPHSVIIKQVFTISTELFSQGEKHGAAPNYCLDSIQKVQEKARLTFWSSTMHYKDYYKQLDEITRAHPEYQLVEYHRNLTGDSYKLVWDQDSIDQAVKKLSQMEIPPYLLGPPRFYTLDEPWGKEVWGWIIKNAKILEQTKGLREKLLKDLEKKKN